METRKDGKWTLALGKDIRFLLVAVGGGGIQVGRDVAKRNVRYLETVAVNCDRRVLEEKLFGKQIHIQSFGGEDPSEADIGVHEGLLRAHASRENIASVFKGANCVTIIASLGGGSGSGILPILLDAATRSDDLVHLTLFLIKPFAIEERHRMIAERTMANLYFIEGLTDLKQEGRAQIFVLDNEVTAKLEGHLPLSRLVSGYSDKIARHIEKYISVSETETTLNWIKQSEVNPVANMIPRQTIGLPSVIPTEPLDLSETVTARLAASSTTASPPLPGSDIELVIEAGAAEAAREGPKSPPEPPAKNIIPRL